MHRASRRAVQISLISLVAMLVACGNEEPQTPPADPVEDGNQSKERVTVYSSASPAQLRPVLEAYTAETGIKIELVVDDFPRLAARLVNHGSGPAADLIIAGGVAELADLAQADMLRPTFFADEPAGIAERLADPENVWYALSYRARVIVYNADAVDTDEVRNIVSFDSLRANAWRNRLCISSSRVPGNRAIIATLIRAHGLRETEMIVRSWIANSAGRFFRHDPDLLQALAAGDCHVAIAGTSALAAYTSAVPDSALVVHTIEGERTSQTDITGAAVARHAENPEGAGRLLAWLRTPIPNALFAISGYEFPLSETTDSGATVGKYREFATDPMRVAELAYSMEDAARLAERARYP